MPTPPNVKPVPSLPQFRWNVKAKRYIGPNGRFVSTAKIRTGLDQFITQSVGAMDDISKALARGELTLAQWQTEMMVLSKDANLAGAAMERGGWYNMNQADFGKVGQKVKGEYSYLRNFANEIEAGTQKLDGTLASRSKLYGEQGRVTYYDFATETAKQDGFDEERSRLTPADSCDLCISEDARGWSPIGSIIRIGDRTCLSNCRCYMEFRNSKTSEKRTV